MEKRSFNFTLVLDNCSINFIKEFCRKADFSYYFITKLLCSEKLKFKLRVSVYFSNFFVVFNSNVIDLLTFDKYHTVLSTFLDNLKID